MAALVERRHFCVRRASLHVGVGIPGRGVHEERADGEGGDARSAADGERQDSRQSVLRRKGQARDAGQDDPESDEGERAVEEGFHGQQCSAAAWEKRWTQWEPHTSVTVA
jgi:hypothetical protein